MYTPEFSGVIQGWAINYSRANLWRVEATMTLDDLEQEAYFVYLRCVRKCPVAKTPSQFMALFKMAWANEVNDLATLDTKHRAQPLGSQDEEIGSSDNDGYLSILIRQAPAEVKAVLNLFLNAPTELLEMALQGWKPNDGRSKVNRSKRICRMLGLDESVDVMQMVEDHFLDRR